MGDEHIIAEFLDIAIAVEGDNDELIFARDASGLYFPQGVSQDNAVLAFILADETSEVDTVAFAQSWDQNLGYYAFFSPDSNRDLPVFAQTLRKSFSAGLGRRLGWFDSHGRSIGAISVSDEGDTPAKKLTATTALDLRNFSINIKTLFTDVAVTRVADTIHIAYVNDPFGDSVALSAFTANDQSHQTTVLPQGEHSGLTIAMSKQANGQEQGTLAMELALSLADMAAFEAGLMYFGPPANNANTLDAMWYQTFLPHTSLSAMIGFSANFDPNQPQNSQRTFFAFTDAVVKSGFSTVTGKQIQLALLDETVLDDTQQSARLVFSDRPVNTLDDQQAWYLTPLGGFKMSVVDEVCHAQQQLLCAYTATESFSFSAHQDATDCIRFVAGQPSYREVDLENATFLSDKTTSSYVSFSSTHNQNYYYSQPQPSPLYKNAHAISTNNAGAVNGDDITAFALNFDNLPVWPNLAGQVADNGIIASPAIPMVPYGALAFELMSAQMVERITQVETNNINPMRRGILKSERQSLPMALTAKTANETLTTRMSPLGLLGGFYGNSWQDIELAKDQANNTLTLAKMSEKLTDVMTQNQIFVVASRDNDGTDSLFDFAKDKVDLNDWVFKLDPAGAVSPDGTPPILLLKFYDGKSIEQLVNDVSLWGDAKSFNDQPNQIQQFMQKHIADAKAKVEKDAKSIYSSFVDVVTSSQFNGLLALNVNLALDQLPPPIRALLGGMTKTVNGQLMSNIDAFRVHHIGVAISDTDSSSAEPQLNASAYFALADYEEPKPSGANTALMAAATAPDVDYYAFKVKYLHAQFSNGELSDFSSKIELTINNLFDVNVTLGDTPALPKVSQITDVGVLAKEQDNTITITGSYSNHSGTDTYAFIAENNFEFTFTDNDYLERITFSKIQFSATEDNQDAQQAIANASAKDAGVTSTITSGFSFWGNIKFNKVDILDVFSFDKLVFADLGIAMSYDLTTFDHGQSPTTSLPQLTFSPGNLRFDVSQSKNRKDKDSLLNLIPFKLKSFLYSQDGQDVAKLNYFPIAIDVEGFNANEKAVYKYALIFDLDLGSLGGLVGSLSAFKFSILIGWQPPNADKGLSNALILGLQLPEADGKLEINIEGVLKIVIKHFVLKYAQGKDGKSDLFVLALQNAFMEVFGQRMPPNKGVIDLAIFAPTDGPDKDANKVGWLAAYQDGENATGDKDKKATTATFIGVSDEPKPDEDSAFSLKYLGLGQRTGPKPDKPPGNFGDFLKFMKGPFFDSIKEGKYNDVYHPDSDWLAVINFDLLKAIDFGFVFYDVTPFYSLKLAIKKIIDAEITYTKVSDDVGLFYTNLGLPEKLRTFDVGAASVRLPSLALSIYTNGDFKVDVGFPANDDWSKSFRVEAQAGPIPVTGSGGFYIAKLSSATDTRFKGDYPTIVAFGFATRLGVGKDINVGPLKAGASLTFFGTLEGAAAYQNLSDSSESSTIEWLTSPKALAIKGQLGIIGEIYGTVDFVLIKASVNIQVMASIGLELLTEDSTDILLYVKASVKATASVKVNLGLFKVSIGFSFYTKLNLEWQLVQGNQNANQRSFAQHCLSLGEIGHGYQPDYPLQAGLPNVLESWLVREYTSVFTDVSNVGEPWVATSLMMEFTDTSTEVTSPAQFKSFDILAAQMTAWALNACLNIEDWDQEVRQAQLKVLNDHPQALVSGLTYQLILQALGSDATGLSLNVINTPQVSEETHVEATIFPMPGFVGLQTSGRQDDEFDFTFADKSQVAKNWVDNQLQSYFEQLYVNIAGGSNNVALAPQDSKIPLIQTVFTDWFQALIRSTVAALLNQMQNDDLDKACVKTLFISVVNSGQMRSVAGQMSQFFRSGLRLPTAPGMEIPAGDLSTTNPLYSLIWQQLPVGTFDQSDEYTLTLHNQDSSQRWLNCQTAITVKKSDVEGFAAHKIDDLTLPTGDQAAQLLQRGDRAYSLENAVQWTQGEDIFSIRPFPVTLTSRLSNPLSPLMLSLKQRATGKSFADDHGQLLDNGQTHWGLQINLVATKVPSGQDQFAPNVYGIGGANLVEQTLLRQLLLLLSAGDNGPVTSIRLLHQPSRDESGLVSDAKPQQLFVLRTNTTTESVPPQLLGLPITLAAELGADQRPPVGANADDVYGFASILEQASVTNQNGYLLFYKDSEGQALPEKLFDGQASGAITVLFEFANTQSTEHNVRVPSFSNTLLIKDVDDNALYYGETTQDIDKTHYVSVASGVAGLSMTRATPDDNDTPVSALNQLYGLVSYQVDQTDGFIASNLSVPVSPQAPDDDESTQDFRLFVPLYNLATANQNTPLPDRYASIGKRYSIHTYVNDAFGNVMPNKRPPVSSTYLYYDDIVSLSQWAGITATFDFDFDTSTSTSTNNSSDIDPQMTVSLSPNIQLLTPEAKNVDSLVALYRQIEQQLKAPGVSLYITTNLNPANREITLSAEQTDAVLGLISNIIATLIGNVATPLVKLPIAVAIEASTLPTVFAIQAAFGIRRDKSLLDPQLLAEGVVIYANAHDVITEVTASQTEGDLSAFAARFSAAFPDYILATGPADGSSIVVGAPTQPRNADDSPPPGHKPQALWAVASAVTDVTVGIDNSIYYQGPTPIDTDLFSQTVDMNSLSDLLPSYDLPREMTFSDIDLDNYSRMAFAAIDNFLAAKNASAAWQLEPNAFNQVTYGREDIADGYANNQVQWLFDQPLTLRGSDDDLAKGREDLAQQMRRSLSSAYAIETIFQVNATFNSALPANISNRLQLFGQVQRVGETDNKGGNKAGDNFGLSSARLNIPAGAGPRTQVLTVLYGLGTQALEDHAKVELDLQWAANHLQVFLEDDIEQDDTARPSIWLQLINGFESAIHIGGEKKTTIALPIREYPTPPTTVSQSAIAGSPPDQAAQLHQAKYALSPLAQFGRWYYQVVYQAHLVSQDQLRLQTTFNRSESNLSASFAVQNSEAQRFTLAQALCRFVAVYQQIQPQLVNLNQQTPKNVLEAFALVVDQLANNSDWQGVRFLNAVNIGQTVEQDIVDDKPISGSDQREITLALDTAFGDANQWIGFKQIAALNPSNMLPYAEQETRQGDHQVSDVYLAKPALDDHWVTHRLQISGLSVLQYENAQLAIQTERNADLLADTTTNPLFVYKTPLVSFSNAVTPFIEESSKINIVDSLTLARDQPLSYYLLALLEAVLNTANIAADVTGQRRLKVDCRYGFPIASASGTSHYDEAFMPLNPTILVRSFNVPNADQSKLLTQWVGNTTDTDTSSYARTLADWASKNGVQFGRNSTPQGARLIFDITLYSQLSDVKLPVLRLTDLQLSTADVAAVDEH
ncbi:MAG: hypothetical protein ACI8WB_002267 [Phenylobacterium sp.]|jgi:hypothetical protein